MSRTQILGWSLVLAITPVSLRADEPKVADRTRSEWLKLIKDETSPRKREGAVVALSLFEGKDLDRVVVDALAYALLSDKSERVRLRRGANPVDVATGTREQPPLLDALGKAVAADTSDDVRLKAAVGIKELRKEDLRKLAPILADLLKADKSAAVRVAAATALGKGGEHAKTFLNALIDGLKDPDPIVRSAVAEAIGRIGDEAKGAVPGLKLILKDTDPGVRLSAAFSLGRVGPEAAAALPELTLALEEDTDASVRKEAARAFYMLGLDAKTAVPALAKALKDDKSVDVRQQAALALGKMRGETGTAAPVMVEAIKKDADKTVRIFVVHAMGDSMGDGLRAYIKDFAEQIVKDPEGDVRLALVQELGVLGPAAKEALPALNRAVADVQLNVRDEAKKAVKKVMGQ